VADNELSEIKHVLATLGQDRPITEVIDQFLETKRWQTGRTYRPILDDFFAQLEVKSLQTLGTIPFDQVGSQIRTFVLQAAKYKIGDRVQANPANPRSLNKYRSAISAFFGFLVDQFGYPKNPVTKYSVPTFKVAQQSNTQSLNEDEAAQVLWYLQKKSGENYASARNYLAFLLLFSFGLRRSEAVQIRRDDIRMDEHRRPYLKVVQKGGTEKDLPIGQTLYHYLLDYQQRFPHPSPFLIRPAKNNRTGILDQPMSGDALYKIVTKLLIQMVPDKNITPHSFRTTFVRLGLEAGEDMSQLRQITGHTSTNMIGYYDTRELHENTCVKRTDRLIGEWTKKE